MAYEWLATLKYYLTVTLCPLSIFTNALLFWLIMYKSSKHSTSYKKVLYLGCIFDFFSSIWFFLGDPEVLTVQGVAFVFSKGVLGYLPFPWTAWTYNLTLFAAYFSMVNALIQFLYRYLLVCWNIQLNKWWFGVLILAGAGIVMLYPGSFLAHLATRTLQDSYYTYLLTDTEFNVGGTVPPFGAYPLKEFPFLLQLIIGMTVGSYCIVIFCGTAVWWKLRKEANLMSKGVQNYQKQISIVMFIEALIPVVSVVIPVVLNIYMILAQISFPWEGKLSFLLIATASVFNPIVKLSVIQTYRRWILKQFRYVTTVNNGTSSNQVTVFVSS